MLTPRAFPSYSQLSLYDHLGEVTPLQIAHMTLAMGEVDKMLFFVGSRYL